MELPVGARDPVRKKKKTRDPGTRANEDFGGAPYVLDPTSPGGGGRRVFSTTAPTPIMRGGAVCVGQGGARPRNEGGREGAAREGGRKRRDMEQALVYLLETQGKNFHIPHTLKRKHSLFLPQQSRSALTLTLSVLSVKKVLQTLAIHNGTSGS